MHSEFLHEYVNLHVKRNIDFSDVFCVRNILIHLNISTKVKSWVLSCKSSFQGNQQWRLLRKNEKYIKENEKEIHITKKERKITFFNAQIKQIKITHKQACNL